MLLSRAWALAATSLGFTVVQLDVSVVNVAIEPIRADFAAPVSGVQWVVSAYTVVFAALILTAGGLGDRIGAKRVFLAGFVVFTVASAGCAFAPDLLSLVIFRAAQGIGAAALVPCSLSLLSHAYPEPAARARAIGVWAAGASVGLAGGPVVGGLLIAALDWRWIFLINLPLGLLGIALAARFAADTPANPDRAFDPPGQLLGVATLAVAAASVIEGGQRGFGAPLVLGGLALALGLGVVFLLVERRVAAPLLPPALFRSRTFSAATAIGLVVNIAFYGLIFVLSLYFQTTLHYSALATGLAFVPAMGIVLAANIVSGRLSNRFGARAVIATSSLAFAVALAGLFPADADTGYPALVGQLVLFGAAQGVLVPAMTAALLESADRSRSGVASGTLNTSRQAGSVLGVALFGSFAATDVVPGLRLSLLVSIGLALVVVLLSTAMRAPRRIVAARPGAGE